jgi:putative hydrolase of the HAD superfamily
VGPLEPTERELRRAARERALQLLYESEIKGQPTAALIDELPVAPADLTLELVRGVQNHSERIDELLAGKVAPRWTVARLAAVDRSVLRLGAYELLEVRERPQAVVINEAVILARRFGSDDSPRFVNGVLSAIGAEVREGEAAASAEAERATRLVDAVIFDLDGVIRHWDDNALQRADEQLGLPVGTIATAAFSSPRFERAMRGELTMGQWAADIGAAVAEDHGAMPEAVTLAFSQVGWSIDQRVMDLVDQVRERVPVALLSNASSRLVEDLRRSHIFDRFDTVLGSAELGVCKPETAAFQAALDGLQVSPERCLLVDDNDENVAAAKAMGMPAVLFSDVDELENRLAAAGLLVT